MTEYSINSTEDFYRGKNASLFWEATICRSLSDPSSAYSRTLENPRTYGGILADFISRRLSGKSLGAVLEIGGGEGTLMEEFFPRISPESVTMVDISPRLSEMQQQRLSAFGPIAFTVSDALSWLANTEQCFDLVISNENVGDFQTVLFEDRSVVEGLASIGDGSDPAQRAAALAVRYGLSLEPSGTVAINLGALELVEKLKGKAGAAFISEHSSRARAASPYEFLVPVADGRVRRIPLKDHDEYTIDFDHMEAVAKACGFDVERIWMPVFLGVRSDRGARFAAAAECVGLGETEVVHEFLNHLKEYECMWLTCG